MLFAVCAPGLEPVLEEEMRALGLPGRALAGGVEVQGALPEETAHGGYAMSIARPRVALRRHGVEEECAVAGAPPRDDVEIEALLRADGLAHREETIVEDVVHFLRWRHDDLDGKKCPSIGERRSRSARAPAGRECPYRRPTC